MNDYKQCSRCNEVVSTNSRFCLQCGHSAFSDLTPNLAERMSDSKNLTDLCLRIEASRLIIASILSGGLYIFYWLYITWKQLAKETNNQHFPVWHALTWAVPIYQLARLHRHATVIQDLASRAGVPTTLSAGTVVALGFASFGLGLASLFTFHPVLSFVLPVMDITLTTTIIVWNQGALNAYWVTRYGENLEAAPIEKAEGFIVLFAVSALAWIFILT